MPALARRVLSRTSFRPSAILVPRVLLALLLVRLPVCSLLVPMLALRYNKPLFNCPSKITVADKSQLELADEIVATLGDDPQVIEAAKALVAAEKNFNPFVQNIPTICNNPALPTTQALRGIVPKVDPAVAGADIQNANSQQSLTNPFNSNGLSVADISRAQGFSNFTDQV